MLQPNFIEIYYDIHYFDAQKSVHQKNVLRRFLIWLRLVSSHLLIKWLQSNLMIFMHILSNLIYPFSIIEERFCSAHLNSKSQNAYFNLVKKVLKARLFKLFLFCFLDYIITSINNLVIVHILIFSVCQIGTKLPPWLWSLFTS